MYNDQSNGSKINQSGTVTVTANGSGIHNLSSEDVEIIQSGLITTSASASYGIFNDVSENTIIRNSGTISTSGNTGFAVYNEASHNVTIINSGLIETTDATTAAILIVNSSNTHLINSGTIKSNDVNAISILASVDNPMLTLQSGSNIQGLVYVDSLALDLNVEKGLNLQLSLNQFGADFGDLDVDGAYVLLNGKQIAVLDKTLYAMQVDMAHDLSDAILDHIDHDCCREICGCGLWTKTIGSYRHRKENDLLVSYKDWQIGQILGWEKKWCAATVGLFGGYLYGEGEVDDTIEKACTNTYFGGLSYTKSFCGTCVGLTFVGGYVDWDQKRMVMDNLAQNGVVIGKSDTSATFVTSELMLSRQFCFPCVNPKFSFAIRHAGLYLGDYAEKGYIEDLNIKDRDIDLFTLRLEAAAPYEICNFCIEPFIGVYGRYQVRGENVELVEAATKFDSGSISDTAAFLFGVRGDGCICNKEVSFSVSADFDYDNSTRVLGSLGLRF